MSRLTDLKESQKVEKFYPFLISSILLVVVILCDYNAVAHKEFGAVLSATINVSAVIVGFMATMVAVLISTINRRTLRRIEENQAMGLLNSYFQSALISGIILAVISTVLTMTIGTDNLTTKIASCAWIFLATFFILSSLRVILIMLAILRSFSMEETNKNKSGKIEADPDKAFMGANRN